MSLPPIDTASPNDAYSILKNLQYLEAFLHETLRLHRESRQTRAFAAQISPAKAIILRRWKHDRGWPGQAKQASILS